MRTVILATAALAFLTACETPTTQRYAISADNNVSIRALNRTGIGVSTFTASTAFDPACRALGPMRVADGLTHVQYIQKAFEDELKIAGAFASAPARVELAGNVDNITFSSMRAMTGGSWTINLTLTSSNGRRLSVAEYYEFESGFAANEACRNTAEAFSRAVQNLIGKAVRDPAFSALVT